MAENHRTPEQEVCPKCKTPVVIAPGIGPYCPNKTCDVIDNLKGEPVKLQSHPASKNEVVLRGDKKCPHGYTSRSKCTSCDHEDDIAELDRRNLALVRVGAKLMEERDRLRAALIRYGVHLPDCATKRRVSDPCTCGLYAALSGEPASPKRAYYETHDPPHCPTCDCGSGHETSAAQAPIVRVVIENGKAAYTTIYAPGLPDGTHDLCCVPEAVAPMMRDETAAERAVAAIAETIRGLTGARREAAVRILQGWNEMMRGTPASPQKAGDEP